MSTHVRKVNITNDAIRRIPWCKFFCDEGTSEGKFWRIRKMAARTAKREHLKNFPFMHLHVLVLCTDQQDGNLIHVMSPPLAQTLPLLVHKSLLIYTVWAVCDMTIFRFQMWWMFTCNCFRTWRGIPPDDERAADTCFDVLGFERVLPEGHVHPWKAI
jgi:hypothetical protein